MSGLSRCNPLERFTGLAGLYAQCRPTYPEPALDFIMSHCGLGRDSLLVDVGCGTGISSRLFAQRAVRVIGIDPNADMRRQAEAETVPPDCPAPEYRDGRGEATGLPAVSADVVLAAQAFHWFEPEAALREFHRVLKPNGWAVLLGYERDERDPLTAAYGAVFRAVPGAAALERERARAGEPLLASPLFQDGQRVVFPHEESLDLDRLLGRAFSASYAPREPEQATAFATALRAAFVRFQHQGQVVLHYETSVYLGRRHAG
jgi:SAM-dependent methyltransferase